MAKRPVRLLTRIHVALILHMWMSGIRHGRCELEAWMSQQSILESMPKKLENPDTLHFTVGYTYGYFKEG